MTEEVEAVAFPKGVRIDLIQLARDNAHGVIGADKIPSPKAYTNGMRVALDYLLGSSHVSDSLLGRRSDQIDIRAARIAVLSALSRKGLLRNLPRRIADRLLTAEERETGTVTFPSLATGRARRVKFVLA